MVKCGDRDMNTVLKRTMTLDTEHGLHLRAAAMLARTASEFAADLKISYDNKTVNGKSTVGLMTLGAPQGGLITVMADGDDAARALDGIEALLRDDAFVHQPCDVV